MEWNLFELIWSHDNNNTWKLWNMYERDILHTSNTHISCVCPVYISMTVCDIQRLVHYALIKVA